MIYACRSEKDYRCVESEADFAPGEYVSSVRPEPPPLTKEELQIQIVARINAERDRREQTSFPYQGKLIDSDPIAVQRITVASSTASMALSAGAPFALDWTCSDNTLLPLDAMGMLGMMQALGSHELALHNYARNLKSAVLGSDNPEIIDILTGWPE